MDKIFIAGVNGYAVVGGCELVMACDSRVSSHQALFSLPEIKLGILPGSVGMQRLSRLVGAGRGLELMLLGKFISVLKALQWGLLNRVVPNASLIREAFIMARTMTSVGLAFDKECCVYVFEH